MPYSLILAILLSSPLGPVLVKQEIKTESQEKCEVLREYVIKNAELSADLPLLAAQATCEKRVET